MTGELAALIQKPSRDFRRAKRSANQRVPLAGEGLTAAPAAQIRGLSNRDETAVASIAKHLTGCIHFPFDSSAIPRRSQPSSLLGRKVPKVYPSAITPTLARPVLLLVTNRLHFPRKSIHCFVAWTSLRLIIKLTPNIES